MTADESIQAVRDRLERFVEVRDREVLLMELLEAIVAALDAIRSERR